MSNNLYQSEVIGLTEDTTFSCSIGYRYLGVLAKRVLDEPCCILENQDGDLEFAGSIGPIYALIKITKENVLKSILFYEPRCMKAYVNKCSSEGTHTIKYITKDVFSEIKEEE